jgi:hypothetical protein
MRNRNQDDDERHRGEFSAGPFGRRPDGSFGGDYARDTGWSGGGSHDDYTPPRWGGQGAPGDWIGSYRSGRGTSSVGYGPGQSRGTYGQDDRNLGGSAAAYGGDGSTAALRGVSYRGRGPKNWRRSDERIGEEVNERLTHHDGVDATDIEVTVEDGEVTLNGRVATRWEKRVAEDVVDLVSGVRDVHNRLTVSEREPHIGKASE